MEMQQAASIPDTVEDRRAKYRNMFEAMECAQFWAGDQAYEVYNCLEFLIFKGFIRNTVLANIIADFAMQPLELSDPYKLEARCNPDSTPVSPPPTCSDTENYLQIYDSFGVNPSQALKNLRKIV